MNVCKVMATKDVTDGDRPKTVRKVAAFARISKLQQFNWLLDSGWYSQMFQSG